jgi:hypothetical protein
MEGRDGGLIFEGTIPPFAVGSEENQEKPQSG